MPNPDAQPDRVKPTRSTDPRENPLDALELVVLRQPKLNLGQVVMTANALDVLTLDDVNAALSRHRCGDWGDVCLEDRQTNDRRCQELGMVLSAYDSAKGKRFWVITDPGHLVTTVLLPDDY